MHNTRHFYISFLFLLLLLSAGGRLCAQLENGTDENNDSISYFDSTKSGSFSPVVSRNISDSVIRKLKTDKDYWYANLAPEKKKELKAEEQPDASIFQKQWFKTLIWMLIIGVFISVLIFYLASSNIRLFRKAPGKISSADDQLTEEDIYALNFEKEIRLAISNANYRLATRLLYLQTLKLLSEKDLIRFSHERTNNDYLFELMGTPYYRDFFRITRDFNYTWYGHFPLTEDSFNAIQNDFAHFKQQLQA